MQHTGTKTLETDRLLLRQFRIDDAEYMFKNWASDSKVTEFLTWPPHENVEVTKNVLENWINKYSDLSFYNWVIEFKDIGEIVGNISVIKLDDRIEAAEIGYCMGSQWWGQAIMPEALGAVITYLLDDVGINRVAACHDSNNPKSGRVMVKAGMKLEGVLRESAINRHGRYDKVQYSILKSDRL